MAIGIGSAIRVNDQAPSQYHGLSGIVCKSDCGMWVISTDAATECYFYTHELDELSPLDNDTQQSLSFTTDDGIKFVCCYFCFGSTTKNIIGKCGHTIYICCECDDRKRTVKNCYDCTKKKLGI
jgi:hypothetical protein